MPTDGTVALNTLRSCEGPGRTAFFNGRLLSAEDLQREQGLREFGERRLAQLIGCGIDHGLEVTKEAEPAMVKVAAGLGVTPNGAVIDFPETKVSLAAIAQGLRPGAFSKCETFGDITGATAGLYLLVLTPGWSPAGHAPTLFAGDGECNRKVENPAARVRLVAVTTPSESNDATLKNQIALSLLAPHPGQATGMVGWMRVDAVPKLGPDDLPLAILRLGEQAQILFVDSQAPRRRLSPPPGGSQDALWPQSRVVEMEAFAQQFLTQVRNGNGSDAFEKLPPAVIVDKTDSEALSRLPKVLGVNPRVLQTRSRGLLTCLLRDGLLQEPIKSDARNFETFQDETRVLWRVRTPQDQPNGVPA